MVRCRDCVYWAILEREKRVRRCYIRYEHMTRREAVQDRECDFFLDHLEACAKLRGGER